MRERAKAQAQDQTSLATANQIKLAVDREFYSVLGAAAVLAVARQTVASRQLLADQVECAGAEQTQIVAGHGLCQYES